MVNAAYHTANTFTSETVEPEVLIHNIAESGQSVNAHWPYRKGRIRSPRKVEPRLRAYPEVGNVL